MPNSKTEGVLKMNNPKAVANSGATKPNTTNGKEIEAAETPVIPVKPELSNFSVSAPDTQRQTQQPKPIEERIKRFYELGKLMERRDTLVEHLEKLGGFNVTPTGSAHLKITDDKGSSFGIAHPIVIGEMVHLAKQKLQSELTIVENQIIL